MLPELNDRVKTAAKTIEKAMLDMHADDLGIHVNTLISTVAAITAEAALRATIPEGELYSKRGVIFSGQVNGIICEEKGGNILDYILFTGKKVGLSEHKFPNIDDIFRAAVIGIDKNQLPVLSIPMEHRPNFWAMAGAAYARDKILEIYRRNRLSSGEAVLAMTLVLCRILTVTKDTLAPEIAFRLALETLIGVAKLHPIAVEDFEQMAQQ
ncbi:MAG: hypothetical protein WDO70_10940 [Alphaproteobacteria bacterium]